MNVRNSRREIVQEDDDEYEEEVLDDSYEEEEAIHEEDEPNSCEQRQFAEHQHIVKENYSSRHFWKHPYDELDIGARQPSELSHRTHSRGQIRIGTEDSEQHGIDPPETNLLLEPSEDALSRNFKEENHILPSPTIAAVSRPILLTEQTKSEKEFRTFFLDESLSTRENSRHDIVSSEDSSRIYLEDRTQWPNDGLVLNNQEKPANRNVVLSREKIHPRTILGGKGTVVKEKDHRWWGTTEWCLLILLLAIFVAVLLVILYFVVIDKPNPTKVNPTPSPTTFYIGDLPTTPLDPFEPNVCDFSNQVQPHVLAQCSCNGKITSLTADTRAKYEYIRNNFVVPKLYSTWDFPIASCVAANQALVWLATTHAANYRDLTQKYVLALMYFQTDGGSWSVQDHWLGESDVCDWHGTRCIGGDVFQIQLEETGMKGPIISELGLLPRLQELSLPRNALSGPLPTEVFGLPDLVILTLSRNSLGGSIPSEIGIAAPKLQVIRLNDNLLEGSIPPEVGKSTLLQQLDLSQNKFEGTLPTELNQLTLLSFLNLENNRGITGRISTEFGLFHDLQYLLVSNTTLSGQFPMQYGSLTKLKELGMIETFVGGDISESIARATSLTQIDLSSSRFRKRIPSSIGNLVKLKQISLQNNSLTGPIPTEVGLLTQLKSLFLLRTEYSMCLRPLLRLAPCPEILTLQGNNFTGRISSAICALRNFRLQTLTIDCAGKGDVGGQAGVSCPMPSCCSDCVVNGRPNA